MGKHKFYDCRWDIKHIRNGKVIWEVLDKSNILTDEGEKAIGEVFFRDLGSTYFPSTNFFVGLYNGTISEATTLALIPSEPSGNGYARQELERSNVGFPTAEKHEGDWRWVSKELTLIAVGGTIGPVNGAFLGTTLNDTGSLIGAVAMSYERTILPGDQVIIVIRAKLK